jgi:hypothetical protein
VAEDVYSDASEDYVAPRGKAAAAKAKPKTKPNPKAAPKKAATKATVAPSGPIVLDDSSEEEAPRAKRPAPAVASPEAASFFSASGSTPKKARKLPGSITGGASKAAVISKWK